MTLVTKELEGISGLAHVGDAGEDAQGEDLLEQILEAAGVAEDAKEDPLDPRRVVLEEPTLRGRSPGLEVVEASSEDRALVHVRRGRGLGLGGADEVEARRHDGSS